ncbi:hypothetical protein [Aliiroseovarius sp. S253]
MGLLFHPFKLIILVGAGFTAGVIYERGVLGDKCETRGGEMEQGVCIGAK